MGFLRPKEQKTPKQVDPGESMGEYLFGQDFKNYQGVTDPELQERLISAEETFRPRYAALELQDIATSARGGYGQPGLFDLLEEQSQRAGDLQRSEAEKQRAADVGALQEYAPQVVEAYRQADPYSTKLADLAQQQAETLYAEGEGELSPERRRAAEQAARETAMQQGRIGDQSLMAGELLGRERFRSGLRQEARQAGAQAFGMQRGMAGDVGMTLLGRPTQSIGLGGQLLGQSQGLAAGPMGPQLFDPNVGINMALQQRGQNMSLMGANAQAQASSQAGMMGALGGLAQGIGAAGGIAAFCWVAREVYGSYNPQWLLFRKWMFDESPSWFFNLYVKYGERFAKFISNKPKLKLIIRKWMDTKIK